MGRNTSVTLGDHFNKFVTEQIDSGRFETASEVMRAGLRLLEEREEKVAALNAALQAGEDSGFTQFDVHEFLDLLAAQPGAGRPIDEVRPGYRRARHGSHLIFYRQVEDGVEIVRVLHQQMDPTLHL